MKRLRTIASLTALAIIGMQEAALSQTQTFKSFGAKGNPSFHFRTATPAVKGTKAEGVIDNYERRLNAKLNGCGYQSVSAGKGSGIGEITWGTSGILTAAAIASLPKFDGSCTTTGALAPKVAGDPVPTSHYVNTGGTIFVKMDPGTTRYKARFLNFPVTATADNCGIYQFSIPAPKEGESLTAITNSAITILNETFTLENIVRTSPYGFCRNTWGRFDASSVVSQAFQWFTLPN